MDAWTHQMRGWGTITEKLATMRKIWRLVQLMGNTHVELMGNLLGGAFFRLLVLKDSRRCNVRGEGRIHVLLHYECTHPQYKQGRSQVHWKYRDDAGPVLLPRASKKEKKNLSNYLLHCVPTERHKIKLFRTPSKN